uniref:helix-turn-helix domain-containing protein n=1 Tax=Empedobacter brevis TaxID=247 RepID=UPI0039AEEE12
MSIGLRIKEIRNFLGLNQIDFAKKIGIKQSPLSQMEGGRILPSIDTISEIIRNFNISYDWLIDGKGQMLKENSEKKSVTKSVTFLQDSKSTENVTLLDEPKQDYSILPKVVTVDNYGRDNVVLVPNKAAAGYLAGYGD